MLIQVRRDLYLNPDHIVSVVFDEMTTHPVLLEMVTTDDDGLQVSYRLSPGEWARIKPLIVAEAQSGLEASADDLKRVSTSQAVDEIIQDEKRSVAVPVPFEQGKYTCPYCNSECTRAFCVHCFSTLLEDPDQ